MFQNVRGLLSWARRNVVVVFVEEESSLVVKSLPGSYVLVGLDSFKFVMFHWLLRVLPVVGFCSPFRSFVTSAKFLFSLGL
jgi:hypothetical protein